MCLYSLNIKIILIAIITFKIKDNRDLIQGVSKLDNLLIISVFQKPTGSTPDDSLDSSNDNTEKRRKRVYEEQMLEKHILKQNLQQRVRGDNQFSFIDGCSDNEFFVVEHISKTSFMLYPKSEASPRSDSLDSFIDKKYKREESMRE